MLISNFFTTSAYWSPAVLSLLALKRVVTVYDIEVFHNLSVYTNMCTVPVLIMSLLTLAAFIHTAEFIAESSWYV